MTDTGPASTPAVPVTDLTPDQAAHDAAVPDVPVALPEPTPAEADPLDTSTPLPPEPASPPSADSTGTGSVTSADAGTTSPAAPADEAVFAAEVAPPAPAEETPVAADVAPAASATVTDAAPVATETPAEFIRQSETVGADVETLVREIHADIQTIKEYVATSVPVFADAAEQVKREGLGGLLGVLPKLRDLF